MTESALALKADAQDIIKEHVKKLFVELLPDDKLNSAIEDEFKKFFVVPKKEHRGPGWEYNQINLEVTPFEYMIRRELQNHFQKLVQAALEDMSNKCSYPGTSGDGYEAVQDIIKGCGEEVWKMTLAVIISNSTALLGQNIQQMLQSRDNPNIY